MPRILLLLLAAACAPSPISLQTGPRGFTADDYSRVYEDWTRDADKFAWGNLDDILHVTATFESWEFRWAYIVRYAEDHSLEAPRRAEMLRATLDDASENHRFFVTLAGVNFREQNLSARTSAWRIILVDPEGRQTVPAEIRRVRRPSAVEQVYFPSVHPHRQTFRIVFPATREDGTETIPADAESVVLRFAGPRGRVDLTWRFDLPS
ncbi:MAG: hypothetical protein AAGE52_32750 [Myxococcota bacterium]